LLSKTLGKKNTCPNPSVHSKLICPDLTVHNQSFWQTNKGEWLRDSSLTGAAILTGLIEGLSFYDRIMGGRRK
jgi:hypothetical protein